MNGLYDVRLRRVRVTTLLWKSNQIYYQILHLLFRYCDAGQGVELLHTAVCNSDLVYAD